VLFSLILTGIIIWCRRRRRTLALSETIADGNPYQLQPSWISGLRKGQAPAPINAWNHPDQPQSQPQTLADTTGETIEGSISSGIHHDGSPPNANVKSRGRFTKHRGDFKAQSATPRDTIMNSNSSDQAQSGRGLDNSNIVGSRSTVSRSRRRPHDSNRGATEVSSPSTSRGHQATTSFSIPTRDEDAGLLYREDRADPLLPPAYNPGWNPG
jgi:hypothetical protein